MSVDLDAGSAVLKALAEPMRLRIVERLGAEQLCVCHLVEELGVPQPLVSHHLRVLRDAGLVEAEKYRYWTYYRLRTDAVAGLAERLGRLSAASVSGAPRRPCC